MFVKKKNKQTLKKYIKSLVKIVKKRKKTNKQFVKVPSLKNKKRQKKAYRIHQRAVKLFKKKKKLLVNIC